MNFEEYPQRYEVFKNVVEQIKVIGSTDNSTVLALSQNYVAKVPVSPSYYLNHEYQIQLALYEAQLPVPRPLGIFRFHQDKHLDEYGVGLIMQRLHGTCGDQTSGKTREIVEDALEKQIGHCVKLGFEPFDPGLHNCIWNEQEEKLYLIDFDSWLIKKTKRPKSDSCLA